MNGETRAALVLVAAASTLTCAPIQMVTGDTRGWSAPEAQCARWSGDGRFYCTAAPARQFEAPRPLEVPVFLTRFSGSTWAACGFDASGNAYCWRWHQRFEDGREVLALGVDSLSARTGVRFRQVASGGDWVCGVDAQETAWCGAMLPPMPHGCLNDVRNIVCAREPVRVASGVRFASVDVGESEHGPYGFACGLTREGQVYCWHRDGVFLFTESGDPELCRIPRLRLFYCAREARPVHTTARFTSISVGTGYACGITTGAQVLCWGYGGPIQNTRAARDCDMRSDFICTAVPSRVIGTASATAVDAGDLHACIITPDGSGICWGNGSMGQLGGPAEASSSYGDGALVTVQGGHRWREITTGPFLTCGITVQGAWYCWGQQPVDGSFVPPQRIQIPVSAAAGG
jgi:hypothetical protein